MNEKKHNKIFLYNYFKFICIKYYVIEKIICLFYYLILLPFFKNIFTVYSNEIGRILNNT